MALQLTAGLAYNPAIYNHTQKKNSCINVFSEKVGIIKDFKACNDDVKRKRARDLRYR